MEKDKIIQNSISKIENWSGGEIILKALDKFSELDIFLVGGVVRDEILGRPSLPKDFDFVLVGPDTQPFISWIACKGKLTAGQFLSPRWSPEKDPLTYCDLMDVKLWNTGVGKCRSAEDVLRQFDFTGNALAINLRSKILTNPSMGCEDLSKKLLRAIRFDFPDKAIRSDTALTKMAIHWFRYIYYAHTLELNIEKTTMRWIEENAQFKRQIDLYCHEFSKEKKYIKKITSPF